MASLTRRVRIYQRSDGKWEWQLRARNGRRMFGSEPQGFRSSRDARRAWAEARSAMHPDEQIVMEVVGA